MPRWVYRFCPAGTALAAFLGMTCIYIYGDRELYDQILTAYGIVPFRFPFVDISGSLAAWECARQGVDVILSNPCDVLHRGYNYSPLWLAAADIPLGVADTTAVGWSLGRLFIASLSLLPPPREPREVILTITATMSTMVVFGLERANPDLFLFMFALSAGLLAEGRLGGRLLGYCIALLAALLKYYPIMLLMIVFRERISVLLAVLLLAVGLLVVFWAFYHADVARGLPHVASGRYDTDLFAAKNLPFMVGIMAENAAGPSPSAAAVGYIATVGLYAALVGALFAIYRRLEGLPELRAALASLPRRERILLVIGSAAIVGCFFAGQSIGYRGVFLLLVLPGLLAVARSPLRELRVLGVGTSIVIVLLMWGECLRLALHRALELPGISEVLSNEAKIQFWLLRELCWWWVVSVMLAVIVDFLRDSPVVRGAWALFGRTPARV